MQYQPQADLALDRLHLDPAKHTRSIQCPVLIYTIVQFPASGGNRDGRSRGGSIVSPQHSNRAALIEGTLRCLEQLPPERITARAIAAESGANLASITYHFGSKNNLVTEAVIEGLDRWLTEVVSGLGDLPEQTPAARFRRVAEAVDARSERHAGLARHFLGALARAPHDARIRDSLARGFRDSREDVARVLGLGPGQEGQDAAGLVLAMFHGLLFAGLLEPALAIEGDRLARAQDRLLREMLDGGNAA
jgi:AcrR family transcriptional regulator